MLLTFLEATLFLDPSSNVPEHVRTNTPPEREKQRNKERVGGNSLSTAPGWQLEESDASCSAKALIKSPRN